MSTQPIIFLLLFGGVQGLLFVAFLLRRKLHMHGYLFLFAYLGVLLLQITLKVMDKVWLMDHWSALYSLGHYLPLMYGPFLFLFVQQKLNHQKLTGDAWKHFVPFIFLMVVLVVEKLASVPRWMELIIYNPYLRFILLMASITWYHSKALLTWKTELPKSPQKAESNIQDVWIYEFIRRSFIVTSLIVIALYLLYINYPDGHGYRYGFIALTCFIYWITWSSLKQPALFAVHPDHVSHNTLPTLRIHRRITKYSHSTLDQTEKNRIISALEQSMERDKLYLEPSLTIDELARKIKCSRHVLSQVLNESIGKSFYDYINHFRVEAAKMLLLSPSGKQYKIASIAFDAGFNSLSTFNDVFRKLAGCTPSQFSNKESLRQRV